MPACLPACSVGHQDWVHIAALGAVCLTPPGVASPWRPAPIRSRTLLHFVAREVARLLPAAASLAAELPSAGAAAQLDLPALMAELREMAAEARCAGCWAVVCARLPPQWSAS